MNDILKEFYVENKMNIASACSNVGLGNPISLTLIKGKPIVIAEKGSIMFDRGLNGKFIPITASPNIMIDKL